MLYVCVCVCDRVANERCEKKRKEQNRKKRFIASSSDTKRQGKKTKKKKKKGIHFHSRYGVGWWRGKRTLVASLLPFIERRRPTPKENAANKWIPKHMTTTLCCEQRYKVCFICTDGEQFPTQRKVFPCYSFFRLKRKRKSALQFLYGDINSLLCVFHK